MHIATQAPMPASKTWHPALPSLQDLAATPGLGALIMAVVPLPDRVRLRGICRAFAAAVDASLESLASINPDDLSDLDKEGQSNGQVLWWLATRCPSLHTLEVQDHPGNHPIQRWWRLPIADEVVTHVAAHCRQLRTLNLRGCKGVGDAALRSVAANCGELRHLDVSECELVSDAGVSAIAAACCWLESLDVRRVRGWDRNGNRAPHIVTDVGILAVAARCARLRHLGVRGTGVTSAGISAVARGCPELRSLNAGSRVDDASIVALAENCCWLERVECDFNRVGDVGIAALLSRCAWLTDLSIGAFVTDRSFDALGPDSCRHLGSLHVSSKSMTGAAAASLARHCGGLTVLGLSGTSAATDASLAAFAANCPMLEELTLRYCRQVSLDGGVLAVASHCPRLVAVSVKGCDGVTDEGMAEFVRRCPGLRSLNLSRSLTGNRTVLAAAQTCPDLRSLDVSRDRRYLLSEREEETCVKDDTLAAVLHNCLKLETLDLGCCWGLSDAGILMVGDSCKLLRELRVAFCRFTNQGLAAMAANLGALEVLHARRCDAVTDVSVVALAEHCPRLRHVDISGCGVGDRGVGGLASHCPALVELLVRQCAGVTDAGLGMLGERCPQLYELDVSYCTGVTLRGVLAVAAKCRRLRTLSVIHCALTPSDVGLVRTACPHVENVFGPAALGGDEDDG